MLKIITDSSAEIDREEAERMGIRIVPVNIAFGEEYYIDGIEISKDEFYERLTGDEFPHTSQPSVEQFSEAFKECEGDETLVILISSTLSGTINSANIAKKDGGFDKVYIYDSLCTTAMQRILVEEACKNRDKTAEEVIKILDELRPRIRLYAELDTLTYLQKGGRINKSAALVGGLLGIKPIITVNTEGIIVNCKKARGSKKAIIEVASEYRKADVDGRYPVYYLYCKENANCETLKNITGGESCKDFNICCAIGSHIGPNAAGIVYVEKR